MNDIRITVVCRLVSVRPSEMREPGHMVLRQRVREKDWESPSSVMLEMLEMIPRYCVTGEGAG